MSFRVLIADDEALSRKDLRELLEEQGYDVIAEAKDGEQALAAVKTFEPDVLILDIKMPKVDGLEVAKQVSHRYPTIMLTAHSSPDFIRTARDAGVMAYLTKPFREKDIAPAIELAVTHFMRETHLSERVTVLGDQLESRKLIDRAKGIFMEAKKITEREAYRQMQELSMHQNISMKELAELIIKKIAK